MLKSSDVSKSYDAIFKFKTIGINCQNYLKINIYILNNDYAM